RTGRHGQCRTPGPRRTGFLEVVRSRSERTALGGVSGLCSVEVPARYPSVPLSPSSEGERGRAADATGIPTERADDVGRSRTAFPRAGMMGGMFATTRW